MSDVRHRFQDGDQVLLVDQRGKRHLIFLRKADTFHSDRGWIPHDEGMLGQSAERVLTGEVPHVDYEEPYTGGLSLMHALVFRLAGIDLIFPRWLLFAGAVGLAVVPALAQEPQQQPEKKEEPKDPFDTDNKDGDKKLIDKDELRVAIELGNDPTMKSTGFVHAKCAKAFAKGGALAERLKAKSKKLSKADWAELERML